MSAGVTWLAKVVGKGYGGIQDKREVQFWKKKKSDEKVTQPWSCGWWLRGWEQYCPFNDGLFYCPVLSTTSSRAEPSYRSLQQETAQHCSDGQEKQGTVVTSRLMLKFPGTKPGQFFEQDGLVVFIIPRFQTHMKWALDEKGLITNNLQGDESLLLISVF